MNKPSLEELKNVFGSKTYIRGFNYYKNGHVCLGVIKDDRLWGKVYGTGSAPYKVQVDVSDKIYSRCSCPVGVMCKHGVALLLTWINCKEDFLDIDLFKSNLRDKRKDELLNMILSVVVDDPFKITLFTSSKIETEKVIDLDAIKKRINNTNLDYYDSNPVYKIVSELEPVKNLAQNLKPEDAVYVYIILINKCLELYLEIQDVYDLEDLIEECVEDCCNSLNLFGGEKPIYLKEIIDLVLLEDYGFDVENMLFAMAAKNNIQIIVEELQAEIKQLEGAESQNQYKRGKLINIIYHLYRYLGLKEEAVIAISRMELKNKDDYLRLGKALISAKRYEEASKYIKEGVMLEDVDFRLDELFFNTLNQLAVDKWNDINLDLLKTVAVRLLNTVNGLDKNYTSIKEVFKKMNKYDELMNIIKKDCLDNNKVLILLYDGYLDDAIKYARSSTTINPDTLIKTAKFAKDNQKIEDAIYLTIKTTKNPWINVDDTLIELIELTVETTSEEKLKDMMDYVEKVEVAKILALKLLNRDEKYTYELLLKILNHLEKEEIKNYAKKLSKEHTINLSKKWIQQRVNRSHVHYNDAIIILTMLKQLMEENEFKNYYYYFARKNQGKKKLINKIRFLDPEIV